MMVSYAQTETQARHRPFGFMMMALLMSGCVTAQPVYGPSRRPVYDRTTDPLAETNRTMRSLESILNSARRIERTISGGHRY
jgi:hypothetical protein